MEASVPPESSNSVELVEREPVRSEQAAELVELKQFKWKLVDEAETPVKGVKVTATGLWYQEQPDVFCDWPVEKAKQTEFLTDENGEVQIDYPVSLGVATHPMTTSTLLMQYSHFDFVTGFAELDLTLGETTQKLVKGCSAIFRCTDASGSAIREFAVLMPENGATFQLNDGQSRSNSLPEGTWQAMLVVPNNNRHYQFSEVFEATGSREQTSTSELKVAPGLRLTGILSENVPRPILDGKVFAWIVPKPLGSSLVESPSIRWLEETNISADGTFEFPSLPVCQSVQLIALCNGWLIEGRQAATTKGIEISIEEHQIAEKLASDITLKMEPTGSLEVKVLDPDGKPLMGAQVSTWPTQTFSHFGEAGLLGEVVGTINDLEAQVAGKARPPLPDLNESGRYIQRTNAQGTALLRDIPLGQDLELFVIHESLTAKPTNNSSAENLLNEAIIYQCESPELKSMTVQMHPAQKLTFDGPNTSPLKKAD